MRDPLPKIAKKGLSLALRSEGKDFVIEPIDASRGIYSINRKRIVLDPKSSVFNQYLKIREVLGTGDASTVSFDLFTPAHAIAWFLVVGVGLLLLALLAGVCSFVPKCPQLREEFARKFASRPKNMNNDPMHSFTDAYALLTETYSTLGCPSSDSKIRSVCEKTRMEAIKLCRELKSMGQRNPFYFERTKDKKILNEKEFRAIRCENVDRLEALSISEGYAKRKAQLSSKPSPIVAPKREAPESGVK